MPAAGATFAAIAAVAVEEDALTDQDVLVQLLPPIEELEAILGGLRTMLEIHLLARRIRATSSGLFILDGSFYSALLEINRLLVRYAQDARSPRPAAWWAPFAALIERFFADEDWRLVLDCRRVIAHPKQATAADDVAQLAPHLSGTVTDRTLWSTVLDAGEHSLPAPLIRQDRPHLLTGYRSPGLPDFAERRAAIEQGYGQLYITYYRPDAEGPAYRLELPAALIAPLRNGRSAIEIVGMLVLEEDERAADRDHRLVRILFPEQPFVHFRAIIGIGGNQLRLRNLRQMQHDPVRLRERAAIGQHDDRHLRGGIELQEFFRLRRAGEIIGLDPFVGNGE